MAQHELDAKGLRCPLPVLRAQKLLKGLPAGDVLVVEATDPGAPGDFAAFCAATGNRLLASTHADGIHRIAVERAG